VAPSAVCECGFGAVRSCAQCDRALCARHVIVGEPPPWTDEGRRRALLQQRVHVGTGDRLVRLWDRLRATALCRQCMVMHERNAVTQ
jgi:hypothetical protein